MPQKDYCHARHSVVYCTGPGAGKTRYWMARPQNLASVFRDPVQRPAPQAHRNTMSHAAVPFSRAEKPTARQGIQAPPGRSVCAPRTGLFRPGTQHHGCRPDPQNKTRRRDPMNRQHRRKSTSRAHAVRHLFRVGAAALLALAASVTLLNLALPSRVQADPASPAAPPIWTSPSKTSFSCSGT